SVPAPVSKTKLLFPKLVLAPIVALLLNTVAPLSAINTFPLPPSPTMKPARLFQPEPLPVSTTVLLFALKPEPTTPSLHDNQPPALTSARLHMLPPPRTSSP